MNMIAAPRRRMTVDEFLEWEPGDGQRWQLVDAGPQPMAPTNRTHGMDLSRGYTVEQKFLPDPILGIEVLSSSNARETWSNVWSYPTIASMRELLTVETESIGVELIRRGLDGEGPDQSDPVATGSFRLSSIDVELSIAERYRSTMFDRS